MPMLLILEIKIDNFSTCISPCEIFLLFSILTMKQGCVTFPDFSSRQKLITFLGFPVQENNFFVFTAFL